MAVPPEEATKYGVVEVAERLDDRLTRVSRIVEKPPVDQAPSNLAAVAGYLLTPDIFTYLEQTQAGQGGEIWLADGVQKIAERGNFYALEFEGRRYDAGNKLEFLQATVELALEPPGSGRPVRGVAARARPGRAYGSAELTEDEAGSSASSPNAWSTRSAISPAMPSDEVAPGDGALRTWMTRRSVLNTKSSTRLPSAASAWARTPDGPGSRSASVSSGT